MVGRMFIAGGPVPPKCLGVNPTPLRRRMAELALSIMPRSRCTAKVEVEGRRWRGGLRARLVEASAVASTKLWAHPCACSFVVRAERWRVAGPYLTRYNRKFCAVRVAKQYTVRIKNATHFASKNGCFLIYATV